MSKLTVKCPYCKSDFSPLSFRILHSPKFGDLALSTFFCPSCLCVLGFSWLPRDAALKINPAKPQDSDPISVGGLSGGSPA